MWAACNVALDGASYECAIAPTSREVGVAMARMARTAKTVGDCGEKKIARSTYPSA